MDEQERFRREAIRERIAFHTIGAAVAKNAGVGTGILVSDGGRRFVLTAEHVVRGVALDDIRIWFRPSSAIVEKDARSAVPKDFGGFTFGESVPFVRAGFVSERDLAYLEIPSSYVIPHHCLPYDLCKSESFVRWPDERLDGVTVICYGFPVQNSLEITTSNGVFNALGSVFHECNYDRKLNDTEWKFLASEFSSAKDFLIAYPDSDYVYPKGFSGCGVWAVGGEEVESRVWQPDPLLMGVARSFVPTRGLLVASKFPFARFES